MYDKIAMISEDSAAQDQHDGPVTLLTGATAHCQRLYVCHLATDRDKCRRVTGLNGSQTVPLQLKESDFFVFMRVALI